MPVDGFAFERIVDELTDRFTFKELGPDFYRATFVEDFVLVFIDDGCITRRRGVEGAVGKKLVDHFRSFGRTP